MSTADKPLRTWQEIAEDASREQDPKRLAELSKEMERAFESVTNDAELAWPTSPKTAEKR
jgi:hypothetical protein